MFLPFATFLSSLLSFVWWAVTNLNFIAQLPYSPPITSASLLFFYRRPKTHTQIWIRTDLDAGLRILNLPLRCLPTGGSNWLQSWSICSSSCFDAPLRVTRGYASLPIGYKVSSCWLRLVRRYIVPCRPRKEMHVKGTCLGEEGKTHGETTQRERNKEFIFGVSQSPIDPEPNLTDAAAVSFWSAAISHAFLPFALYVALPQRGFPQLVQASTH